MARKKKVAIACQGGGSHAAFASGVLRRLLAPDLRDRYELVGLSGTSGGAMCAALAWSGLQAGGPDEAIARLAAFWNDLKASTYTDALLNLWGMVAARAPVTAEVSPYMYRPVAEEQLSALVHRHVRLHELTQAAREAFPVKLLIGATDVQNGERVIFGSQAVTDRHLIASAAVPPLFRAIEIDGRNYWDGLFTSNPPVREFTDDTMMAAKPEEIWIVQINPHKQADVPQSISDIVDRRNELAGNLALAQELFFIERMNALTKLVSQHGPKVPWKYEHIEVKTVEMPVAGLDYPSKLDRSPLFMQRLIDAGWVEGARFLDDADLPKSGSIPTKNRCVL